jgi:hypothetical protein
VKAGKRQFHLLLFLEIDRLSRISWWKEEVFIERNKVKAGKRDSFKLRGE